MPNAGDNRRAKATEFERLPDGASGSSPALDDAPNYRRERTASAAEPSISMPLPIYWQSSYYSILSNTQLRERRDATSLPRKFSLAAQHLTLELTGRDEPLK